jgi:hypothetical protein
MCNGYEKLCVMKCTVTIIANINVCSYECSYQMFLINTLLIMKLCCPGARHVMVLINSGQWVQIKAIQ